MFIGIYTLENKTYNDIYFKECGGYNAFHHHTFSPDCEDIKILDFTIKGKTYEEKKASAEELAKEWQLNFAQYSWSYGELAEIEAYFEKVGKRFGLLKEFKENGII